MEHISPNYNLENEVKQIKITEENLSESCILCQLLRTKTLASESKCMNHFFKFLPLLALYLLSGCDLFNMAHQYMPKIFNDPHKNPPPPPRRTYLMYGL